MWRVRDFPAGSVTVQVVAHRGSSEDIPEHTLAAYKKAIEDGADALECDVRLTADGHLVCVHDRRVDRVSNGRGVVSTLELRDLSELDFGSWKDDWSDFEEPDVDRNNVLTLERLLDLVAGCDRPVELAIETKHPTRYAGAVERRLVELLHRYGWAHPRLGWTAPVRVMSFSQLSLRRIRRLAPSLQTVLLMHKVPIRFRDGTLPVGCRIAGVAIEVIQRYPRYVRKVHAHGHQVHVFTVNRMREVDLCVEVGVDAVITDRPMAVLERIGRAGASGPG
jgi:glycerophosphoryl diester phosphodiesterase